MIGWLCRRLTCGSSRSRSMKFYSTSTSIVPRAPGLRQRSPATGPTRPDWVIRKPGPNWPVSKTRG